MKKITLLLLILIISHQAFSQSKSSIKRMEIGITTSLGSFDLSKTFHSKTFPLCFEGCAITGTNPSRSFSAGITGRYKFNSRFSITSGISYASNSYNEEFTGGTGGGFFTNDTRRQFDFFEVPLIVHATVYSLPNNPISLFAETGIINSINLTKSFPSSESNIELNRYGISGTVSAGIRLQASKFNLEIAPFYTHSFTSYAKDVRPSVTTQNYTPAEFKPHSMGIKLNVLVPIKI